MFSVNASDLEKEKTYHIVVDFNVEVTSFQMTPSMAVTLESDTLRFEIYLLKSLVACKYLLQIR